MKLVNLKSLLPSKYHTQSGYGQEINGKTREKVSKKKQESIVCVQQAAVFIG